MPRMRSSAHAAREPESNITLSGALASVHRAVGRRAQARARATGSDRILRAELARIDAGVAGVAIASRMPCGRWVADAAGKTCQHAETGQYQPGPSPIADRGAESFAHGGSLRSYGS